MKTKLALALVAAALAGCATVSKESAPAVYFTDTEGKPHVLTGEVLKELTDSGVYVQWRYGIRVAIDGSVIAQGGLSPHNFSGTVTGKYKDSPAVVNCTSRPTNPGYHDVSCDVSLSGRSVGVLKF